MVWRFLKAALALVIVAALLTALWRQREGAALLLNARWPYVLSAFGMCLGYRVLNSFCWYGVLRSLGEHPALLATSRVWLVSEATRWLPGSVWNLISRAGMAREIGITRLKASASITLELVLTIIAWSLTASLLLLHGAPVLECLPSLDPIVAVVAISFGALLISVALKHGHRFIPGALKEKFKRFKSGLVAIQSMRPDLKTSLRVTGYYTALCFVQGLALWVLFFACDPSGVPPVTAVIGANALAWIIGFLAIFSPGGLVVREGVLVVMLAAWAPPAQVAAIALAWRVVQISSELVCLAIALSPVGRLARLTVDSPASCQQAT